MQFLQPIIITDRKMNKLLKKNILINFFQTLIARIFLSFAYPGAVMKLDQERVLKTKDQLKAIGAKFISLKTPDGDTLSANLYRKVF